MELGSNCFDTLIPFAEAGWHGIFVEPVPHYMANLRQLGNFSNCAYEQCAIVSDPSISSIKMARYDENHIPVDQGWMHGIGHIDSDIQTGEKLITDTHKLDIPVVKWMAHAKTLDQIILEYNVHHIDFMKIDIEGHEIDIIKQYSWNVIPKIIKVEHAHCDDDLMKLLLEQHGYHVYYEHNDLYGIRL